MLRRGLFITTDILTLEQAFLGEEEGVETPTSRLIVLRHLGKRLTLVTINPDFFGRRGADVSLRVPPERPITTMVLGHLSVNC